MVHAQFTRFTACARLALVWLTSVAPQEDHPTCWVRLVAHLRFIVGEHCPLNSTCTRTHVCTRAYLCLCGAHQPNTTHTTLRNHTNTQPVNMRSCCPHAAEATTQPTHATQRKPKLFSPETGRLRPPCPSLCLAPRKRPDQTSTEAGRSQALARALKLCVASDFTPHGMCVTCVCVLFRVWYVMGGPPPPAPIVVVAFAPCPPLGRHRCPPPPTLVIAPMLSLASYP